MASSERAHHRRGTLYYLGVCGQGLGQLYLVGDEGRESIAVSDVN
jgi:hypothetical protein